MRSGRQSWAGAVRRLQMYGLALAALFVVLGGQGCEPAAPATEDAVSLSQLRLEPQFDARSRAALELAAHTEGRSQHALAVPEPVKVVVTVEAADLGQISQEILPSGGMFATAEILVTQGSARTISVIYLDSASAGGTGTSIGATADTSVVEKPSALAFDLQGNLLIGAIATTGARRGVVLRLNQTTNTLTIIAGTVNAAVPSQDGVLATSSGLDEIRGIAADAFGNLYVSTTAGAMGDGIVRQITPEGVILTIAGNRTASPGIGAPATNFALSSPEQIVAFPPDDELLIALTGDVAIKSLR